MITKTKGKKFNGDIITLRDGKSIGCCDTTTIGVSYANG